MKLPVDHLLLFDGVCNLCNSTVNWLIDHDPDQKLYFASLQSPIGQSVLVHWQLNQADFESVILVKNNQLYRKSEAALEVLRLLGKGWQLLYFLKIVPMPIRDWVYNWVARNRYKWFGKKEACRIPSPELKARFLE